MILLLANKISWLGFAINGRAGTRHRWMSGTTTAFSICATPWRKQW